MAISRVKYGRLVIVLFCFVYVFECSSDFQELFWLSLIWTQLQYFEGQNLYGKIIPVLVLLLIYV